MYSKIKCIQENQSEYTFLINISQVYNNFMIISKDFLILQLIRL